MSYQALARKWRPRNFSQLVGQTHVRTALENALSQGRLHPALLFSGTRGVGKTTLARIIASCLNCETGVTASPCGECSACQEIEQGRFVDLIEVDAASRTKVDDTRELLENVPYAPARGRFKVYLIDEVHMLSKSSFNALLKTLEEPPSHVQFLFATTDPQKLPVTILSRCLQFHLKRITVDLIADRMRFILGEERIESDDEGLARLARAADGSLRDGLSLLDQAIAFGGGAVRGPDVAQMLGSIERRDLLTIAKAVAANDASAAWAAIDAIEEQGLDFVEVLDELCRLWQRIAVGQRVPQAWDEVEKAELSELAQAFAPEDLQVYYQIAVNARKDIDWAPDPRSGFEMTVLRTLAFLPDGGGAASGGPGRASSAGQGASAAGATAAAPSRQARRHDEQPPESAGAMHPSAGATLQAGQLDWTALVPQLHLSGVAQLVAESSEIASQDASGLTLRVGSDCTALCTRRVEQQLLKALQQVLGEAFTLKFDRSTQAQAPATTQAQNPEEQFLSHPGVARLVETFDARLQPGTLRVSDDGKPTLN